MKKSSRSITNDTWHFIPWSATGVELELSNLTLTQHLIFNFTFNFLTFDSYDSASFHTTKRDPTRTYPQSRSSQRSTLASNGRQCCTNNYDCTAETSHLLKTRRVRWVMRKGCQSRLDLAARKMEVDFEKRPEEWAARWWLCDDKNTRYLWPCGAELLSQYRRT